MAEIKVTGNKLLKTLMAEFQAEFNYLRLGFFSLEDWEKANSSGGTIHELNSSKRLSEVRTKKPSGENEISIHGNTLVKNIEKNFKEIYGICVQVCYNKKGERFYTSGKADELSLSALNKFLSENGYEKNPK